MPKDRTAPTDAWYKETLGAPARLVLVAGSVVALIGMGLAAAVYETSTWGRHYIRQRLGLIK